MHSFRLIVVQLPYKINFAKLQIFGNSGCYPTFHLSGFQHAKMGRAKRNTKQPIPTGLPLGMDCAQAVPWAWSSGSMARLYSLR